MHGAIWFVVVGLLFVVMALAGSVLKRLPLSTSMLYLAAGAALGPLGAGLLHVDVYAQSQLWERVTEIAVVVSLFAAGLKLRMPFSDRGWMLPVRLATVSMLVTIGLVSLAGVYLMGLSPGAAILLGAILAPTDPVLASEVQVTDPADGDRLRFGLTGEAGLNDGTAFPFVMLGLGLLGVHDLGANGWRWIAIDLLWAVAAGLATGSVLGTLVGRLVLYLRKTHREAVGLDDFLALGLIALSYGVALLVMGYGFLAVFAAGLALRRIERKAAGGDEPPDDVRVDAASARGGEAGDRSRKGAGLHGAGGAGVHGAAGAHRRGGRGAAAGGNALGGLSAAGGDLVPSPALSGDPPRRRVRRHRGRAAPRPRSAGSSRGSASAASAPCTT